MFLIKLPFKLLAIPVMIALTLLQWFGTFLTKFSSFLLNLAAGLYFLAAIACYAMQISNGTETIQMLCIGFAFYILPHIACWFLVRIAAANLLLREFILS